MYIEIGDYNLVNGIVDFGYDAVIIPMGINNSFNSPLRYELSLNFPIIKVADADTGYGDKRKYGSVIYVHTEFTTFCLCYVDDGGYTGKDPIRYSDVEKCFSELNKKYKGKNIAAVKFWDNNDTMCDILNNINFNLYLYDRTDFQKEIFKKIAELRKLYKDKLIDQKEYIQKRSEIEWIRKNGILKEMPKEYIYHPKSKNKKG